MCPVCGGYVALMTMLICDHTEGFLRVCYYLNWTAQRASPFSKFDTSDIDTTLCTHLVYAFGEIDTSQKTLSISSSTDYRHFNELKTENPELKTLLSLGGDTDRGESFLNVSQTDTSADTFATNTVGILRILGFDGLDIYWIHKTTSENYLRLLRSIRRAFDVDPGSPRLLLTINILALRNELAEAPIIQEISKEYIDYAILMTFDFVSSFYDQLAHYDSPLYAIEGANFNKEHSTEWAVSFYRSLGLSLHKTIIAVRGAGKWQVLKDTSLTDLGSPTKTEPYGTFFKVSPEYMLPGAIVYPEICRFMLSNASTVRVFDEKHKAVYLVSGENWISYEDTDTIREKVTWARKNGLAGFMFWSLDQDDFSGTGCEQGRYPLLSTVKKVMEALDSSPDNLDTTSTDSVKTTHTTAPTKPPGALTTATRKTTETKLSGIETTVTMLSETKNKEPPRVVNFTVNGQKSVYLRDDDNADFFCEVDGIPTPTAYLNGSFLSKIHDLSNSSPIVSSSLTSVSCEDSGRYFCYGRNGHENTSSFEADYVDINVTCKPRLLPSEAKYENESKVVRISVDTNTVFTFIIYGYPEPTQFVLKVEKDNVFQDLTVHHEVTYTKLTPPFGMVNVTIYDANTKETKTYNLNIKNEAGMVDIKFNVIKEETDRPTSGGDDVGMKVGIGVGVGLGVLLLAAVIIVTVCIVRRRRLKKTPRQPPPQFFNPAFDKPEFHKKRQINLETDYIN